MKIERQNRGVAAPYRPVGLRPDGAPGEQPAAQAAGLSTARVDEVSFSGRARQVASARQALKAVPEVRLDLVERIKAAVEAGEYNVPPAKVAEKLLRSGVLD
jgi:flagellar biosynthesis anti-sigma factor FlgM